MLTGRRRNSPRSRRIGSADKRHTRGLLSGLASSSVNIKTTANLVGQDDVSLAALSAIGDAGTGNSTSTSSAVTGAKADAAFKPSPFSQPENISYDHEAATLWPPVHQTGDKRLCCCKPRKCKAGSTQRALAKNLAPPVYHGPAPPLCCKFYTDVSSCPQPSTTHWYRYHLVREPTYCEAPVRLPAGASAPIRSADDLSPDDFSRLVTQVVSGTGAWTRAGMKTAKAKTFFRGSPRPEGALLTVSEHLGAGEQPVEQPVMTGNPSLETPRMHNIVAYPIELKNTRTMSNLLEATEVAADTVFSGTTLHGGTGQLGLRVQLSPFAQKVEQSLREHVCPKTPINNVECPKTFYRVDPKDVVLEKLHKGFTADSVARYGPGIYLAEDVESILQYFDEDMRANGVLKVRVYGWTGWKFWDLPDGVSRWYDPAISTNPCPDTGCKKVQPVDVERKFVVTSDPLLIFPEVLYYDRTPANMDLTNLLRTTIDLDLLQSEGLML